MSTFSNLQRLIQRILSYDSAVCEKKKTIINTTFYYALRRGSIHLFPILVSATLIIMNTKHVYIGPDLVFHSLTTADSLAAFQIAAKLQEVLAVASMAVIIFEVIRHQVLYGEGLPLVLLSSGFTFSRFGFLSSATWSWLWSPSGRWEKGFVLLPITFIALLALVFGPATAVLMRPRIEDHAVYTPTFWLTGGRDEIFPTILNKSHIGYVPTSEVTEPNACALPTSFTNEQCVSRAYQKMQALLGSTPNTSHWDWQAIFRDVSMARVLALHEHNETWTRAPHVATSFVQNILWWDTTWFGRFRQAPSGRVSTVKSKAANVRTACMWQNVTITTDNVEFPLLELYSTFSYNVTTTVPVQPNLWSQDNISFADSDIVKTVWIDGTQMIDAVTAGLLVLAPLEKSSDTFRQAVACSIDARWGDSNHVQADGPLNIAISADVMYQRPDDGTGSRFWPANNTHWKHINASMVWLDAITPTVPYLSPELELTKNASTIANLLMSTGHGPIIPIQNYTDGYQDSPYQFWESLIATYFADSVARIGYSQQLNSDLFYVQGSDLGLNHECVKFIGVAAHNVSSCPKDRPNSDDSTPLLLNGTLADIYTYRASARTDFASIAIVFVYICLATGHFFYCLIKGRSSQAWEKLDDMLALAHSSRPDPLVLSNTSAGIGTSNTRAKPVRIVVIEEKDKEIGIDDADAEDDSGSGRSSSSSSSSLSLTVAKKSSFTRDEEAVQMRFVETISMHNDDDGGTSTEFGRVEAGMKYGKV